MFIQRSQYLKKIKRVRVSEGRDLNNGLRLDRNEKVEPWGKEFISSIFKDKPDWLMSVYPENDTIYKKLSAFLKIKKENIKITTFINKACTTMTSLI